MKNVRIKLVANLLKDINFKKAMKFSSLLISKNKDKDFRTIKLYKELNINEKINFKFNVWKFNHEPDDNQFPLLLLKYVRYYRGKKNITLREYERPLFNYDAFN